MGSESSYEQDARANQAEIDAAAAVAAAEAAAKLAEEAKAKEALEQAEREKKWAEEEAERLRNNPPATIDEQSELEKCQKKITELEATIAEITAKMETLQSSIPTPAQVATVAAGVAEETTENVLSEQATENSLPLSAAPDGPGKSNNPETPPQDSAQSPVEIITEQISQSADAPEKKVGKRYRLI